MGKGEVARYEQFLLFPQCFQRTCAADTQKPGLVWERVNSTKRQISWLDQIESINRQQNISDSKIEIFVGKIRKYCGKIPVPAFSPFPTMFSKVVCLKVVKSQDRVVNS